VGERKEQVHTVRTSSDVEMRLQDDEEEHEQQEMMAWTSMDGKLVLRFMRSTGRCRPGICRTPPGHSSANSAVAMIDGAQSLIAATLLCRRGPVPHLHWQGEPESQRGRTDRKKGGGKAWHRAPSTLRLSTRESVD